MDGNYALLGGFCGQIKPVLDESGNRPVNCPDMTDLTERPNTIPWPPLLFAGAALLADALQLAEMALELLGAGAGISACSSCSGNECTWIHAGRRGHWRRGGFATGFGCLVIVGSDFFA